MTQVAFLTKDRLNGDFYRDAHDYKRGMVIGVYRSGQQHSERMLTRPNLRIIDFTNLPYGDEAKAFLSPQVLTLDDSVTEKTQGRREFVLDLDNPNLPQAVKDFIADDSRKVPVLTVNLSLASLRQLKKKAVRVSDPMRVLGN